MTDSELASLKNYLRVDYTDDDELIKSLQSAAIEFVQNSTGKQYSSSDKLYSLCVNILVAHWYENRDNVAQYTNEMPYTTKTIMNHIALSSSYDEVS